mgnify:CR=1 FL=1
MNKVHQVVVRKNSWDHLDCDEIVSLPEEKWRECHKSKGNNNPSIVEWEKKKRVKMDNWKENNKS